MRTLTKFLTQDEVRSLGPKERDEYVRNTILEILNRHRRGVIVSQVSALTPFSRVTVAKHLDMLVALGEAYKIERGNLSIYYRNGKVIHESDLRSRRVGGRLYTFYKLENDEGQFIYIQEKEEDAFRSTKVKGGIMISLSDFPDFVRELEKFGRYGIRSE